MTDLEHVNKNEIVVRYDDRAGRTVMVPTLGECTRDLPGGVVYCNGKYYWNNADRSDSAVLLPLNPLTLSRAREYERKDPFAILSSHGNAPSLTSRTRVWFPLALELALGDKLYVNEVRLFALRSDVAQLKIMLPPMNVDNREWFSHRFGGTPSTDAVLARYECISAELDLINDAYNRLTAELTKIYYNHIACAGADVGGRFSPPASGLVQDGLRLISICPGDELLINTQMGKGNLLIALCDYRARTPNELSFAKGDILGCGDCPENRMWRGVGYGTTRGDVCSSRVSKLVPVTTRSKSDAGFPWACGLVPANRLERIMDRMFRVDLSEAIERVMGSFKWTAVDEGINNHVGFAVGGRRAGSRSQARDWEWHRAMYKRRRCCPDAGRDTAKWPRLVLHPLGPANAIRNPGAVAGDAVVERLGGG